MDKKLFDLKNSLKDLTKKLITRIDVVCEDLKSNEIERLQFWLEDLSVLTEVTMLLIKNDSLEFEIEIFNEKFEMLLDKVEEKDYLFVCDILQIEILPLLSYLDGCMTND